MPFDLRTFALASFFCALPLAAAFAGDPTGLWLTKGGKARVQVGDCGGALCGTIVWLKDPNDPATGHPKTDGNNADPKLRARPLVGIQVVSGMHQTAGADKWTGSVYSIERGKSYSGTLVLQSPTSLKVEGCFLAMCDGEVWTRDAASPGRGSAQRAR
jgi:uncharacterized protein (DUF2147 family)